jgi:branched-chain amino acid transport system ATP-binding protein
MKDDSGALLELEGISMRFGGVTALRDVGFSVRRGEIFALIGPNGAGKTTLFNVISGVYPSQAGSVIFDGKDLGLVRPHRIAALGIARTFQNIELFDRATVLQNLLIGAHARRRTGLWQDLLFLRATREAECQLRAQVEQVIDFLELQHYRDAPVGSLPYGARKIVELARALCVGPRLLLLDEPSSGLNTEETDDLAFWIQDIRNDMGVTVLMVEHDMSLVSRVSDRVLALDQGRVLALGTPEQVQRDPSVIEAYIGSVDR